MLIFSFTAEGPLTAYLEEKVFMLSDFQKSIADSLLLFIGEHLKPTADSEDLYRSGLEPFRTKPTYFQMLAAYLHQLMLSLADAGAVSAVSSAPVGAAMSSFRSRHSGQVSKCRSTASFDSSPRRFST